MTRFCTALALSLLMLSPALKAPPAWAGDEDEQQEQKAKPETKAPADTALPEEPEDTGASAGIEEEKSPEFTKPEGAAPTPRKARPVRGLDDSIDYSSLLGMVETSEPPHGVLPPAEGFRGYRPNMVAAGYGDRTPGWGGMIEYSWNRIGAGVFGSVLTTVDSNKVHSYQSFGGLYGLYRLLPWGISPYFLLGLEGAYNTPEPLGGLTGGGVEVRIYSGWTGLFGWTYHSTARRGFLGGTLGWSF